MEFYDSLSPGIQTAIITLIIAVIGFIGWALRLIQSSLSDMQEHNTQRAAYFNERLPELDKRMAEMQANLDRKELRIDALEKELALEKALHQKEVALLNQKVSHLEQQLDYYKGMELERDRLRDKGEALQKRVNELTLELASTQQRLFDCEARLNKSDKQEKDKIENE